MSYFSDRRKESYEADKAAIEARKNLSPFADYEGGKYEPMQYEGREIETEDINWLQSHEAAKVPINRL